MNPKTRLSAAALVLAAGLVAAPAAAQEETGGNALRPGATSVNVGVSPDATVGFWRMLSGRTALGVSGSVQGIRSEYGGSELSRTLLVVSPQVKQYRATDGAILPYLHGAVFASVTDLGGSSGAAGDDQSTVLGATAALGLDWFPVRRVSLGGHAGLGLLRSSSEFERPQGDFRSTSWSLQTFTAAIQVQLFL